MVYYRTISPATNHAPPSKITKITPNPTCTWHSGLCLLRCWIGWRFRLRISCGFGFFLHRWRNRRNRCHGCRLRRQVLRHHTAFTGDLHIAGDEFGNFPGAPWIHLEIFFFGGVKQKMERNKFRGVEWFYFLDDKHVEGLFGDTGDGLILKRSRMVRPYDLFSFLLGEGHGSNSCFTLCKKNPPATHSQWTTPGPGPSTWVL